MNVLFFHRYCLSSLFNNLSHVPITVHTYVACHLLHAPATCFGRKTAARYTWVTQGNNLQEPTYVVSFLVAERYKAWVCGRSLAGIVGSNPTGSMEFCLCECCVWSGRGLCDELITRPEESYRVWCV